MEFDDLKHIKKKYGENMSHLCRELFPEILETPGKLYGILASHFAVSRELYDDIIKANKKEEFKNYIYTFYEEEIHGKPATKTVKELLKDAGYTLYEVKNNKDIQKFRKYYSTQGKKYEERLENGLPRHVGEELCTFSDMHRIEKYHIFFLVKDNVAEINRNDFKNPQREDEYGTSVLCLQFSRGNKQRLSIKNRYNHTVPNPDATFSNNLENIAPGLTEAFEKEYGFNIGKAYKSNFELDHYTEANDGKFYKYNLEIGNHYFGKDNIIIDNDEVIDKYQDKSRYLLIDHFIIDLKDKKLFSYFGRFSNNQFTSFFKNIIKIEITNVEDHKEIKIVLDNGNDATIKIDKNSNMIGYRNDYIEFAGTFFMEYCEHLKELYLPNLRECDAYFLNRNKDLEILYAPRLEFCGYNFLWRNKNMKSLDLPSLKICGNAFLENNEKISSLNLPNLEVCGNSFLCDNKELTSLNLPKLRECHSRFLEFNKKINTVSLPSLEICHSYFMSKCRDLKKIELPELKQCGDDFLGDNEKIKSVYLPKLVTCGTYFLSHNTKLRVLELPNLTSCGRGFLEFNNSVRKLFLPSLINCGDGFFKFHYKFGIFSLPNLIEFDNIPVKVPNKILLLKPKLFKKRGKQ